MKNFHKRTLSLMLSCTIAGISAVVPSVSAVDVSRNFPVNYDSTNRGESKEKIEKEEPFKVFDIYNAFFGITTTATSTTTTTKLTTTKTTATTTKKTTKPTTTTKNNTTTANATTSALTSTAVSTTFTTASTEVTTAVTPLVPFYNGIDVSQFQGVIDWQAVKDSGIDFAIIRAGYGKELNQVDPYFYRNIEGAQAVGIDVGIYWYSYADDTATARREAEVCYEIIKNYSLDYPVYFDIEESKHANMTIAQTSAIVDTFCTEMENRGYFVGVYSYANFLQSHVYRSVLEKYDIWVAQYSENLTAYNGHYSMWQYSSTGQVNGIGGNVDVNYCYRDFSQVITANPDPNFVPPETTATTTTTTTRPLCDIVNADSGAVDWTTVSTDILMFAVNNSGKEPDFDALAENLVLKGEKKAGLIWYADKITAEEMAEDAEKLHRFIEDYKFEYPIYLDLTNSIILNSELTNDEISELIKAFCSVFDADKKHYIGIRGYDDFLTDRVNEDIYEAYDVWVVTDDDTISFPYKYGIISRLISDDISRYENECLRNYPAIMVTYHLNGY